MSYQHASFYIARDMDLPSGPARGGDRFERRERFTSPRPERFAPRAPVELPTEPPFTAHIANLSFDANEDDLADFFGQMKVKGIYKGIIIMST